MQLTLSGSGSLAKIPRLIAEQRPAARSIAVISFRGAGNVPSFADFLAGLRGEFKTVTHLPFSSPFLKTEDLAATRARLEQEGPLPPEVFVSIGGGTVMDLAKLLKHSFRAEAPNQLHLAVPTTAGSGSEATCFAVIYSGERKESVEDATLLPDIAVLDPSLLLTLPRQVAVPAGLDALSQAVESIWSVRSTDESVALAERAISRILASIVPFSESRAGEAAVRMLEGASFSGRAIQITRTTLAHALSYPLTARHGIPHGIAVYLNLPRVARFNAGVSDLDCTDPRGAGHVHSRLKMLAGLFQADSLDDWVVRMHELALRLGVSMNPADYGIRSLEDRAWLAAAALASSRTGNNPRRFDPKKFF